MKKTSLFIGILLSLFCFTAITPVGAITYTENIYSAYAEVQMETLVFFDDPWEGSGYTFKSKIFQANDPGPNPPVNASVNHSSDYPYSGSAVVSSYGSPDSIRVSGNGYQAVESATASSHNKREFLSSSPELILNYDYSLYAGKYPTIGTGYASSMCSTKVSLLDKTGNAVLWDHSLSESGGMIHPDDEFKTTFGTVNQMLPVIPGHLYTLTVDVSLDLIVLGAYREVWGGASIANLSVSAVPLPASLGLFVWGLAGLSAPGGLRKFFQNR